jgi:hypothetical protein
MLGASDVLLEMPRKRQLPVVGGGTGVWSFIEVTDAAAATIAAVRHQARFACSVAWKSGRRTACLCIAAPEVNILYCRCGCLW